ncbi:MAG: VapB-type antitoxin [Thermoplasmata archaeon]|nr:VapB-type antitoxin [Thermoplasmata archaeon]
MASTDTSVRVSRETMQQLEGLREVFQTQSADETIRKLIRERRSRALGRMFGSGKGIVTPFLEEDRIAAHD